MRPYLDKILHKKKKKEEEEKEEGQVEWFKSWVTVAYACHSKLYRRLRLEGSQFQESPSKNVCKTPSQWEKVECHSVHLLPSDSSKLKIGRSHSRLAYTRK
jgi:hypothetical protein